MSPLVSSDSSPRRPQDLAFNGLVHTLSGVPRQPRKELITKGLTGPSGNGILGGLPRVSISRGRTEKAGPNGLRGYMKGTGRQLSAIIAAFIGSLVIPAYFLRLLADGRKLHQELLESRLDRRRES
jgi:hypothetical protein